MFADYASSSSESLENGENEKDLNSAPQTGTVDASGDIDESDILAQFYDEIEQVEYSFKSQSGQQTFESVQECVTQSLQDIPETHTKVVIVPEIVPELADERKQEEDLSEIPKTTTQKLRKILLQKGLIRNHSFDYSTPSSEELQIKIEKWTELRTEGLTFNNRLENTHAFKNPSIMSKMISFLELDPYASCLKKEIYDPNVLRKYPDSKQLVERKPTKANNTNRLSFGASQRVEKPSKKSKKRASDSEQRYSIGPKRRI